MRPLISNRASIPLWRRIPLHIRHLLPDPTRRLRETIHTRRHPAPIHRGLTLQDHTHRGQVPIRPALIRGLVRHCLHRRRPPALTGLAIGDRPRHGARRQRSRWEPSSRRYRQNAPQSLSTGSHTGNATAAGSSSVMMAIQWSMLPSPLPDNGLRRHGSRLAPNSRGSLSCRACRLWRRPVEHMRLEMRGERASPDQPPIRRRTGQAASHRRRGIALRQGCDRQVATASQSNRAIIFDVVAMPENARV